MIAGEPRKSRGWGLVRAIIFAGIILFVLSMGSVGMRPTYGQAMREVREVPSDCRSILPSGTAGTLQPWQVFVKLEHCDRIKRLRRLSLALPPEKRPIFYEGFVPASRLPREFGVDVPVLRVVFPDHVFFDTALARLREEARPVTEIVSQSLQNEPPDVALFVAGHADARGSRPYNEALSIDRSHAIADDIYRRGVALATIWRVGFGEDMPLVSGSSSYALDRNRRIEFLFAARPEAIGQWLADQQLDEICSGADRQETQRCRNGLELAPNYDIVEAGPPKHAKRVAPRLTNQPTPVDPHSRHPKSKASLKAPGRVAVEPSGRGTTGIRVSSESLIGTTPSGARRIRIDPRNRRVPPVRVDL